MKFFNIVLEKMAFFFVALVAVIFVVLIFIGVAHAEEKLVAEGRCPYKLTRYPCALLEIDGAYHIILKNGGFPPNEDVVVAVYDLVLVKGVVYKVLVHEWGEMI